MKVFEVYRTPDMTKKQKEEFKRKAKDSTRELKFEIPKKDTNDLDIYA